ncbi:MAG: glycoside hydrolase family 9 protein, partial [Lachnospiraceae bacterium]|nr:glycoside hydrolase family 9 protein [Lachnospiraceae bacterium]
MIAVDQLGYETGAKKHATAVGTASYRLFDRDGGLIREGQCQPASDAASGTEAACIDFSDVTEPGIYYFEDAQGERSCSFSISATPYAQALRDAARMFYFQRCGMELTEEYAGVYAHKACHQGEAVYLDDRTRKRELSGGWHDAGDYGRYVTAASVTLAHLLYSWRLDPRVHAQELHIPETGNGVPDLLNECRYELEWILKMQDADGGVHHKATSLSFVDFIMPEEDAEQVFITPVSSLATADLAAVTALAAGIYRPYDKDFADRLAQAAVLSAQWLKAHRDFLFHNPEECKTGTYEDLCDADERLWAAAELYLLTGEEEYLQIMRQILEIRVDTTALGW